MQFLFTPALGMTDVSDDSELSYHIGPLYVHTDNTKISVFMHA